MKGLKINRIVLELQEEKEGGNQFELSFFPDREPESSIQNYSGHTMTFETLEHMGRLSQRVAEFGLQVQSILKTMFK